MTMKKQTKRPTSKQTAKQTKPKTKATAKAAAVKPPPAAVPAAPAAPAKPEADNWRERWRQRKAEQAAMIADDPQAAMRVAHDRLDYGVEVLCALIEQRALFHVWKSKDGTLDHSWDDAAQCFCSRFSYMTEQAVKFARAGHRDMFGSIWTAAKQLTEVIHDLAFDKNAAPEVARYARGSLFLPSLRARTATGFTHDFQAVADALHLSEDCLCHMADAAGHKLDSPVTRLIAEVVESIGWAQEHLRMGRDSYRRSKALHANAAYMARLPESDAAYARRVDAMTEDEYLVQIHYTRPETLHYDALPPLTKSTAEEWWTKAVRQEVTHRFPDLKGSRLYTLLKGVKDHKKLDDLRRRGKSALHSLARPDPQSPQPS